jgi:hypothetical protein
MNNCQTDELAASIALPEIVNVTMADIAGP